MADRWAVANGNWSSTSTWNGGTLPTSADDVYADGFTVTIDQNINVLSIRTTQRSGGTAGGGFTVSATGLTLTLTASPYGIIPGSTTCLTFSGTGTLNISGGLVGSSTTNTVYGLSVTSTGTVNITGTIWETPSTGTSRNTINSSTNCTVNVTGNVTGVVATADAVLYVINMTGASSVLTVAGNVTGPQQTGIYNSVRAAINTSGSCTITGNVSGGSQAGGGTSNGVITNSGTLTITGNVTGGDILASFSASAYGVQNSGTGTTTITGTVTAGSRVAGSTGQSYGVFNNTTGAVVINGDLVPSASMNAVMNNSYGRFTLNGNFQSNSSGFSAIGKGVFTIEPTAEVYHEYRRQTGGSIGTARKLWTGGTNLGQPAVGNVRSGTVYGASNEYTGTLAVPSPSLVALGVSTDNTTGTYNPQPALLIDTTIATRSSETVFTLTNGSSDDSAYVGQTVIVTKSGSTTRKEIGTVSAYVGSTKQVTLAADAGVMTIAAGDTVQIITGGSSGSSFPSTAPTDWLGASGIAANAITAAKIAASALDDKGNWLKPTVAGRTLAVDASGIVTDTAGTTTLLSRLTSTRAGLLDNLDVAISVIQSQITALNNLSAKTNWFGSALLEIPDSGTRAYVFELVIKDDEDKLVNLDGLPTITLTNSAGTDRSSLITTGIANAATGRYTLTITVGTSTTNEALLLKATGTISGETRYAVLATQVVDYDSGALINSIYTRLGVPATSSIAGDIAATKSSADAAGATASTINTKIGTPSVSVSADIATRLASSSYTAPDNAGIASAASSAATAATQASSAASTASAINTKLGSPANTTVSADIASIKTDTGTTIPGLFTTLTTKIRKFFQLIARKDTAIATDNATELSELNANGGSGAGAFSQATDSLEAIRDRGDAAWTTGGGGGGGDATAANQTTIINHLTDIKGAGWSSTTDTLEKIRDAITAALDSVIASVGVTPGALTGWPETMSIGDSYTDDCSRSIHLLVRDSGNTPITSIGSHAFTDADFTATVILSQGAQRGRVIGTATWVVGPEGYLNVQIPSKESRRAAEGTATVQVLLRWTNSGDQYTLPATTTRWVAQL